jgi:hypothetical protein
LHLTGCPENSGKLRELFGHAVPLTGQIPLAGGRIVERNGKRGVVYDQSPEAEAFSRWQSGQFKDIERGIAKRWRAGLENVDLRSIPDNLRKLGIDSTTCRSLEQAKSLADALVNGTEKHFDRMALALALLKVHPGYIQGVLERWSDCGYPPLARYAPYVAHVVTVELFFYLALAANLISDRRPSHRVDFAYFHYLPFCMVFVSSDRLHKRCAPLFLRANQGFVWGQDLKADLARINNHFANFPEQEKEKGIMAFANVAPDLEGSLVRQLRARHLRPGVDDQQPPPKRNPAADKQLIDELTSWRDAPTVPGAARDAAIREPDMLTIERRVSKRKGSWWQLPKDLRADKQGPSEEP